MRMFHNSKDHISLALNHRGSSLRQLIVRITFTIFAVAGLAFALNALSGELNAPIQQQPALSVVDTSSQAPASPQDAYLELRPAATAPSNGGTAKVGERFVLELWLNGGTGASLVGQQSYLTFTSSLLQNVLVSSIGTSCTLTSTLTPDMHVLDAPLQNEVCNGPQPCVFRGTKIPAGSIAFASGALSKPVAKGSFRVAEIGLCAVAPGQARIHWQLSPPERTQRGTRLVTEGSTSVSRNVPLTDYVIKVVGSTK
jgi:hypothetical protein